MIAGGFDDFDEEGSLEFANMQATSNTETELAAGREPNEMSRPTTSTRAGFMESQGCGVQVLMSAKTAIEMGASIYGIVAYTATATDKAGRSIPAWVHGSASLLLEGRRPDELIGFLFVSHIYKGPDEVCYPRPDKRPPLFQLRSWTLNTGNDN